MGLAETITCCRCKIEQPSENYHRYKDGRQRCCKDCTKANNRRWDELNPGKRSEMQREWYRRNRDRALATAKASRKANPDRDRLATLKRREADPKLAWAKNAINGAKRRARLKGVPLDIDADYLAKIAPDECPVLGLTLVYPVYKAGDGRHVAASPTVDRFVPEAGYVRGNIYVISHRANGLKSDATTAELRAVIRWMECPK